MSTQTADTSKVAAERETYRAYVAAIGRTVGHDASATAARRACPQEFATWRARFITAYRYDPATC